MGLSPVQSADADWKKLQSEGPDQIAQTIENTKDPAKRDELIKDLLNDHNKDLFQKVADAAKRHGGKDWSQFQGDVKHAEGAGVISAKDLQRYAAAHKSDAALAALGKETRLAPQRKFEDSGAGNQGLRAGEQKPSSNPQSEAQKLVRDLRLTSPDGKAGGDYRAGYIDGLLRSGNLENAADAALKYPGQGAWVAMKDGVNDALDHGSISLSDLTKLSDQHRSDKALDGLIQSGTDHVCGSINSAEDAYKSAKEQVEKAQKRLEGELADVGPGLTPEQKNQYEEKFWQLPENKNLKPNEEQKAKDLQTALEKNKGQLEDVIRHGGPAAKQAEDTLANGFKMLAGTGVEGAMAAANFGVEVAKDPKLAKAFEGNKDAKGALGDAVSQALAALVPYYAQAQNGWEQLNQILEPLAGAKTLYEGASGLKDAIPAIRQLVESHGTNFSKFAELVKNPEAFKEMGALEKGLVAGGFVYASGKGLLSGQEGTYDLAKAFTGFVREGGPKGIESIAASIKGETQVLEAGGKAADDFAKFLPGIGAIANLIAAGMDAHDGHYVNAAGDVISAIGCAIEAAPVPVVAQGVGVAIDAIGLCVQGVGTLLQLCGGDPVDLKEKKTLLGQITDKHNKPVFDKNQIDGLANRHGQKSEDAARKREGLTPAEYDAFAKKYPQLAQNADSMRVLEETAKALGIPPDKFGAFVDDLAKAYHGHVDAGVNALRGVLTEAGGRDRSYWEKNGHPRDQDVRTILNQWGTDRNGVYYNLMKEWRSLEHH